MNTTLYVIFVTGLILCTEILGAEVESKKNCSQVKDLLDKLLGKDGVLDNVLEDKAKSEEDGGQSNNALIGTDVGLDLIGGILGLKLRPEVDSKLISALLRDNRLLGNLLGSNGAVPKLVQGLLSDKGSDGNNGASSQNKKGDSNENILSRLLNSLGLLSLLKPQGKKSGGSDPLGGLSVDKVLSNDSIVNGLLKSLLGGDLLDGLLGEDSLVGCLLERILGKLLNGNKSSGGKKGNKNQDSDKKLSLTERILLLQFVNELLSQK